MKKAARQCAAAHFSETETAENYLVAVGLTLVEGAT
jgi:hypothetical protein